MCLSALCVCVRNPATVVFWHSTKTLAGVLVGVALPGAAVSVGAVSTLATVLGAVPGPFAAAWGRCVVARGQIFLYFPVCCSGGSRVLLTSARFTCVH